MKKIQQTNPRHAGVPFQAASALSGKPDCLQAIGSQDGIHLRRW